MIFDLVMNVIKQSTSIHDALKKEIVQLLRFYGFNANDETPAETPEGRYGRADVVGWRGETSIGVEIVDSGDVTRDAKKLVLNEYTYKYVLVINPSKKVDRVVVDGEIVKVLDSELSFEHELRRDLRISPNHPYFTKNDNPSLNVDVVDDTGHILDEVREELSEIGLETFTDDVLDALRRIYISGTFQVERRVGYNPGARVPGRYETVNLPPEILAILEKLKLVDAERVGTGHDRKLILRPNERGNRVGEALIKRAIKRHRNELNRLIEEYPAETWLVLMSSLSEHYPNQDETRVIYEINPMERLYEGAMYRPKPHEGDPLKVLKDIHVRDQPNQYANSPLITMFASFMSRITLRDFAISFFEQLKKFGLAIQEYAYDSRWRPTAVVYKVPREVFEFFITRTRQPPQLAYYAPKLGAYYVIAEVSEIVPAQTARMVYEELTRILELPESIVAEILADMNRRGITSRLVERPDAAPFIVLNKRAFEKYLRDGIEEIARYF